MDIAKKRNGQTALKVSGDIARKAAKDFSDGLVAQNEDTILLVIPKKMDEKIIESATYKYN